MRRDILLITIEGWGINLLAAGGGSLCRTPNLDSLAAGGVVFDQCWSHSPDPLVVLAAIATAGPALDVDAIDWSSENGPLSCLRLDGVHATLVTDSDAAADALGPLFDEAILLSSSADEVQAAATLEETQLSALFQSAAEVLQQSDLDGGSNLVWLHSRGLNAAWDAPYELRTILCAEDDPPPSDSTSPPRVQITPDTDPDVAFDAMCGAAAQGIAVDAAWAMLDRFLEGYVEASARPKPVIAVMGVGGYPLGEHAAIGPSEGPLHSEMIRVPLLIRPGNLDLGRRYPHAVQPRHLGVLIAAAARAGDDDAPDDSWWRLPPRLSGEWPKGSRLAWAYDRTSLTLITAGWVAVRSEASERFKIPENAVHAGLNTLDNPESSRWELYVNPDDRWHQNDVAARAADVLEQFKQIATALEKGLAQRPDATAYAALHAELELMLTEELVTPDL